jgi:Caspase domain
VPLRFDRLPKLFALIIGINVYASDDIRNLRAAVGDADKFEKFVLEKLDVPPDHIINLRDENATREAILNAFTMLRDDVRIVKAEDPAIIIYFAGHGARVNKPEEWKDWESNSGQIEMLAPTDIKTVKSADSGEEKVADGIPDRTISALLNDLSGVKGDNVVSFECDSDVMDLPL